MKRMTILSKIEYTLLTNLGLIADIFVITIIVWWLVALRLWHIR